MQPPAALSRHRELVESHLQSLIDGQEPPELRRMLRYHMGWTDRVGITTSSTGKRLRPALCLLVCESLGGQIEQAVPLAAAVELVHDFSLIHDDLQDRDRTRHGRDTVWAIWGEAQAINAGDALLAIAHRAVASAGGGLPADPVLRATSLLAERTLEMVAGQVTDIEFETRMDVDESEYLAMAAGKTGALFDASLALGAIAAGASPDVVEAFGRCGRSLGIAFQAHDDVLGVWGDEERTGKAQASDVRRRKKSLPVLYAVAQADTEQRSRLADIYSETELLEDDVNWVLELMYDVGAQSHCAGVAQQHRDAALRELDSAGVSAGGASEIRQAVDFLLARDY
jgi:geranylgeranyl diphosphate synthase type I